MPNLRAAGTSPAPPCAYDRSRRWRHLGSSRGTIAPSTTVADTDTVLADGSCKRGPALTCLAADHSAAAFAATGEADAFYSISLATEIKIVNENGTAMRVAGFNGAKTGGRAALEPVN